MLCLVTLWLCHTLQHSVPLDTVAHYNALMQPHNTCFLPNTQSLHSPVVRYVSTNKMVFTSIYTNYTKNFYNETKVMVLWQCPKSLKKLTIPNYNQDYHVSGFFSESVLNVGDSGQISIILVADMFTGRPI